MLVTLLGQGYTHTLRAVLNLHVHLQLMTGDMCGTWHPPTFGCLQPSLLTNRTIGTDLLISATILSLLTTSAHFTYTIFHFSH